LLEMVDEICETEHNAISPDSRPLRLNIGCGPDVRAGYLNIDWRARPGVFPSWTPARWTRCLPMTSSNIFLEVP
jgi:hypothetical protein